jgi:hypothetical protein
MKIIPLTQGFVTRIDDRDFKRVSQFKWYAHKPGNGAVYAKRGIYDPVTQNNDSQSLSVFLMKPKPGQRVDHESGDTLDNRRKNLRRCTRQQNSQAFRRKSPGKSSRFRGVFFNTQAGCWHAVITHQDRRQHLGSFRIEEDAARAYDVAAKKLFGAFAAPNFP